MPSYNFSSTVKALLRDLKMLGHLRDTHSFSQETIGIAQLPDDLLGSVAPILHEGPFMRARPALSALTRSGSVSEGQVICAR